MNTKTNIYYLFIFLIFLFKINFIEAFQCVYNNIDYSPLQTSSYYYSSFSGYSSSYYYIYLNICGQSSSCSTGSDACINLYRDGSWLTYNIGYSNSGSFKSNDSKNVTLSYLSSNTCPSGGSSTLNINFIPSYSSSDAYILRAYESSECVYEVSFVYGYSMVNYISNSNDHSSSGTLDTSCTFQGIDYSPLSNSYGYEYEYYDYSIYAYNYFYFSICTLNQYCSGYFPNSLACMFNSNDYIKYSLGNGNGYFNSIDGNVVLTYYAAGNSQCPDGYRKLNINLIPSYSYGSSYVSVPSQTGTCSYTLNLYYYLSLVNYVNPTRNIDNSTSTSSENISETCTFNGIDFSPLGKNGGYSFYSSNDDIQYYINVCNKSISCQYYYGDTFACFRNYYDNWGGFGSSYDGYFYSNGSNTVLSYYSYNSNCPNNINKININLIPSNSTDSAYINNVYQYSTCSYNVILNYNPSMVNYINNTSSSNGSHSSSSDKDNYLICENVEGNFNTLRTTTNLKEIECIVGNTFNSSSHENSVYCYGLNHYTTCNIDYGTQIYKCSSEFNYGDVSVECSGPNIQCKVSQSYCAIKENVFIVDGLAYGDSVVHIHPKTSNSIQLISNINFIITITLIILIILIN